MSKNDTILDLYPFLSIKEPGETPLGRIAVTYSWVPKLDRRRLRAYTVLAAYAANASNVVRKTEADDLHEYGDANFVCTAMSNAVVGDQVQIVAPKNTEQEEYFRLWAEDELFFAKLVANEYKASNLGDEVYRLNWSENKGRVEVTTLDPGFWFPLNLGRLDEEHNFAWEEINREGQTEIYRERYYRDSTNSGKVTVRLSAAYYKREGSGSLDDLKFIRWAKNSDGKVLNQKDLKIDFFPIVYIPNILREGNDFGESDLTAVWRILDQLSNTYSDEATNAFIMGLAMLGIEAKALEQLPLDDNGNVKLRVGRNIIFPGKAAVVDNSNVNKALIEYQHELEAKLLTNTFLGPNSAGNLKTGSGDRTTGIFQLKGGPLERFIWVKRLMREPKYNKLIKFVAKMCAVHGDEKTKELFASVRDARIQFGNILPIDATALMENISKVMDRLSARDLKDNVREVGLTVFDEMKESAVQTIKQGV